MADHVLAELHVALHLFHGGRRCIEIEHDVMALTVLLDLVGHGPQAPELGLLDLAVAALENLGEARGEFFNLLVGYVLSDDEDVFV